MKFEYEETRWHGSKYHALRPFSSETRQHWQDMESWCQRTFGPLGDVWTANPERYYFNNRRVYFRSEADLALFLLRWS